MIKATVKLKSASPISFSKKIQQPPPVKGQHDAWEAKYWRDRMHTSPDGHVLIPGLMLKNAVAAAARYMSIPIPGQGKATYTKNFEAGIMAIDDIKLKIKAREVEGHWVNVPTDGKRGGTTRVDRCFPYIPAWSGQMEFYVFDELITRELFARVLNGAGQFIGIGRYRPRQNGQYGRFFAEITAWKTCDE